jgi:osmotically-inducible protein OsmY
MLLHQKKMDHQITQDVLDELTFDPAVTVIDLEVKTRDGKVTLSGTSDTYATKWEAEDAAYRVAGVREVENNIIVDPVALGMRMDADIQTSIITALNLDSSVPSDKVSVAVLDGVVTLSGTVDYYYQRAAAEEDASRILGVKFINNLITVDYPASAADIDNRIEQAFARNAELYDDEISVKVEGHKVTLSGDVETHSQKRMAEKIAWMAPGVNEVKNHIFVLDPFSE